MAKIPHTYDDLFTELSKLSGIPAPFLKSLAFHESAMNPMAAPPPEANSSALGMFQILNRTREAYNKATGATFQRDDMTDPYKCGLVACWLLNVIIETYKHVGVIPHDQPELWTTFWQQPGGVGLLFLGYTAGWGEKQGVANIVPRMRAKHIDITVNKVIDAAGVMFPKSQIYVDPAKLGPPDEKGRRWGPYMSDPKLRKHIATEIVDYLKLTAGGEQQLKKDHTMMVLSAVVGTVILIAVMNDS